MKRSTALTLGGLSVLAGTLFLLCPKKADEETKAPFLRRNYAHRGLHTPDQSIPENSLPAFRQAAEAGYGIELDVQLTRDGELVVFHDDDLRRACGVGLPVDQLTFAELRRLSLFGTEERVPLFSEALRVVGGRAPLIVELKTGRRNRELCRKTLAYLRAYCGEVCVESFDPRIVAYFRFHAPRLLRGQLAQQPEAYAWKGFTAFGAFLLGNTLTNWLGRPHFIAYRVGKKPLPVRLAEKLGALRFAWTSHDPAAEAENDAVIFEYYRPEVKF